MEKDSLPPNSPEMLPVTDTWTEMLPLIALLSSIPEVLENQKSAVIEMSRLMLLSTVTVTVCPPSPVFVKVSCALAVKWSVALRETWTAR